MMGSDDEHEDRKPAARPHRKRANAGDVTIEESESDSEGKSDDAKAASLYAKRPYSVAATVTQQPVDLTTAKGQLAVNPRISEEEAKELAKKEYHRRHAARSRVRHRGLMKDLKDKVAELQKTNESLRSTHKALAAQLRAFEALESGIQPSAQQVDALRSARGLSHASGSDCTTGHNLQLAALQGGANHDWHGSSIQTQSHLVGLQSLLQAHIMAQQQRQSTPASLLPMPLHVMSAMVNSNVLNVSTVAAQSRPRPSGDEGTNPLLSELLLRQAIQDAQPRTSSFVAPQDDLSRQLLQLLDSNEALQRATPSTRQDLPTQPSLQSLINSLLQMENAASVPMQESASPEERHRQALVETIIRLLLANRR